MDTIVISLFAVFLVIFEEYEIDCGGIDYFSESN